MVGVYLVYLHKTLQNGAVEFSCRSARQVSWRLSGSTWTNTDFTKATASPAVQLTRPVPSLLFRIVKSQKPVCLGHHLLGL